MKDLYRVFEQIKTTVAYGGQNIYSDPLLMLFFSVLTKEHSYFTTFLPYCATYFMEVFPLATKTLPASIDYAAKGCCNASLPFATKGVEKRYHKNDKKR